MEILNISSQNAPYVGASSLTVQRYNMDLHSGMVDSWYKDRGLTPIPQDMLPPTGIIVPGKAAAWMYRADGGLCLIEGLISSNKISKLERSDAINSVVKALLDVAARTGARRVLSLTQNFQVFERSVNLGFEDFSSRNIFIFKSSYISL